MLYFQRFRKILPELFDSCSDAVLTVVEYEYGRSSLSFLEDAAIGCHTVSLECLHHFTKAIHMIRTLPVLPAAGVLINGEVCRRPLIAKLIRLRQPDRAETSLAS